ncbi:TetR family transcriptional regulator [Babesia caballi]|uniref:TetR family transcriptional regulator n=1 Tax=Babesia caballi TaxID=5871 RepID=A0AAV4LW85_BABCB|nr:TetR family transcriptional regulator [Babesia caballi]
MRGSRILRLSEIEASERKLSLNRKQTDDEGHGPGNHAVAFEPSEDEVVSLVEGLVDELDDEEDDGDGESHPYARAAGVLRRHNDDAADDQHETLAREHDGLPEPVVLLVTVVQETVLHAHVGRVQVLAVHQQHNVREKRNAETPEYQTPKTQQQVRHVTLARVKRTLDAHCRTEYVFARNRLTQVDARAVQQTQHLTRSVAVH